MSSSRNFSAPPNGIICHQGYITKRGANYKTWRRRYFVLLFDGYLLYFKKPDDLHHPLGVIYLQNAFLDRLSPEQCEKSKPHSFVIRSTTRRFVLCADNNTDKETWIRYIERIINQVALKMKMIDTRSSVSTPEAQVRSSNAAPLSQTSDNKENKDVDREIEILGKKISDCILHTNSFESRFKDERSKLNTVKENGKIDNQAAKKNKEEDEETDEEDYDSNESESDDSQSDNEEAPAKGRKRQDTLKPTSKRAASLAKMSQDMDKILNMFVQVNSYLLTIEKEKLQTEADIEELKKHKKLLVKEVKNLREKLK